MTVYKGKIGFTGKSRQRAAKIPKQPVEKKKS